MTDRNPRVLFVGRSRYLLPLPGWLAKKWDAIEEVIDYRVLGAAEPGGETRSERFRLRPPARPRALDGVLFYARLPFRIRRADRRVRPRGDRRRGSVHRCRRSGRPAACRCDDAVDRRGARRLADVHARLRLVRRAAFSRRSPIASASYVLRHADATRGLSGFTSGLIEGVRGEPATATFPTYSDLSAFVAEPVKPLPEQAGRRVRRDARGVQEHRRARRCMASRRRHRPGGATRDHREGQPTTRRRRAAPTTYRNRSSITRSCSRPRSRRSSTRRRCSSCRPGRKASAA